METQRGRPCGEAAFILRWCVCLKLAKTGEPSARRNTSASPFLLSGLCVKPFFISCAVADRLGLWRRGRGLRQLGGRMREGPSCQPRAIRISRRFIGGGLRGELERKAVHAEARRRKWRRREVVPAAKPHSFFGGAFASSWRRLVSLRLGATPLRLPFSSAASA